MRRLAVGALMLILMGCAASSSSQSPPAPAPAPPNQAPAPPAGAERLPGCEPSLVPSPPAESGSPVKVQVWLKEDPGVSAPIVAKVIAPVTVIVRFDQPVDQTTFTLTLADPHCGAVPGTGARWLSDTEAEITLGTEATSAPRPYHLHFGEGKDLRGLKVQRPLFGLLVMEPQAARVLAVPVGGGETVEHVALPPFLRPRSVSPDGRYVLAEREVWAHGHSHHYVRIPYLIERESGEIWPLKRGPLHEIRWDVAQGRVWLNGWRHVGLDGGADSGDKLLEWLPGGMAGLVSAGVSPDGRWFAALKAAGADDYRVLDFQIVELTTGALRTLPGAFLAAEGGMDMLASLQWTPDSKALLIESFRGEPGKEQADFRWLDPTTLKHEPFPVQPDRYSRALLSPGGEYVAVGHYGVVTRDGKDAFRDAVFWTGIWSPDDSMLLLNGNTVLDLPSGRQFTVPGDHRPLGFSADGKTLYVTPQ